MTIQAGSPLWVPRHPSPPAPEKSPNSCFLEQLEAEVSGRPAWRARMGVRMGGPACRRPHPLEGWARAGALKRVGVAWPAGSRRGHRECSTEASRQRPQTMWFQSNCPKILLQHKPRAIHSPATNQQQSYRINRFHTRGPAARGRNPGTQTKAIATRPVSCWGQEPLGQVGSTRRASSSLCDPHPTLGYRAGRCQPLTAWSV